MRLADCFLDALAFVSFLVRDPEAGKAPYEAARRDVEMLLAKGAERGAAFPAEVLAEAAFAVCAWIDEAVLCSGWPGRAQWLHDPLQRARFGTVNAGVEFFERLDALLEGQEAGADQAGRTGAEAAPSVRRQVIEVYAACLGLGFTGRHFQDAGGERLAELRAKCLSLLYGGPQAAVPAWRDLFPAAGAAGGGAAPTRRGLLDPTLIALLLLPVVIAAAMYVTYFSLLERFVSGWIGSS